MFARMLPLALGVVLLLVLDLAAQPPQGQPRGNSAMAQANQFFKVVDANEDGFLDRAELAKALRGVDLADEDEGKEKPGEKKKNVSGAQAAEQGYLKMMDRDGDGRISKREFSETVKPQADQYAQLFNYQQRLMNHQQRKMNQGQSAEYRKQVSQFNSALRKLQQGQKPPGP